MKQAHKTVAFWVFIIVGALVTMILVRQMQESVSTPLEFSEFMQKVSAGEVTSLTVTGDEEISGELSDGTQFVSRGPIKQEYYLQRIEQHIVPNYVKGKDDGGGSAAMVTWALLIFLVLFLFLFMRQLQSGGGKAMQFGKSRARLMSDTGKRVTFEDVAGVEEAKAELEEIIDFLKSPKKVTRLGGRIPKGVLLMGPPGTGKTLLARAIAGEAGVPFFSISGSDFVEMFVGVGASRVRDLFEQGKKNAPCIIFIDEIDAVGRQRGAGLGGGHDEREQTLNQLLVEMDGFESNEGVILIAATNRPDVLDPALLRAGRFDRRVVVPSPDVKGREQILQVHARKLPLANDAELMTIAQGTPGFTGADLEAVLNEAALRAARTDKDAIAMEDLQEARDKIMMGSERRSLVISKEELRTTAFHEAGHAIVASVLPGADPLHRVTVVPRGRALGLTQQLPTEDRHTHDKVSLETNIAILMGGRAAEEIALGQMTTGAGNDIERATELARKMVCEWGMSDIGPLTFGKKQEQIFLGREFANHQDYSEDTARRIDSEVRSIVTRGYELAHSLVDKHRQALDNLSAMLIEKESATGEDVLRIIKSFQPDALGAEG